MHYGKFCFPPCGTSEGTSGSGRQGGSQAAAGHTERGLVTEADGGWHCRLLRSSPGWIGTCMWPITFAQCSMSGCFTQKHHTSLHGAGLPEDEGYGKYKHAEQLS